jgi:uncharacterized protein DUF4260
MNMTARLPLPTASRVALGVAGLTAFAGAVALIGWPALALWLAPDLTMLAGLSADLPRDGRMPARAVPYYNAAHRLAGPLALTAIGAVTGPLALGLGLTWLSHVLVDRAAGYGLRTPDGWQRG